MPEELKITPGRSLNFSLSKFADSIFKEVSYYSDIYTVLYETAQKAYVNALDLSSRKEFQQLR